LGNTGQKGQ